MRALPASAALVSVLALAAGCSSNDSSGTPTPTAVLTTQASPSVPEMTGTPVTPSESPSTLPLLDRLLPTRQVPGLNAQWQWQDGDTGQPTTDPFGVCAKTDLLSIGASDAVERTYFPPDDSDDNAAEQIAEFPDANTAGRAWAVLKSWHDACTRTAADHPGLKVGALTPVAVDAGSARWYLLSWNPPGEETGRFESYGMVLNGTRIAVLKIDNSGPNHTYPAGKEPVATMALAAAGWLR